MKTTSIEHRFPPGPDSRSPFGQLFPFARNPLRFLMKLSGEYGDLVHFKIRRRDVFLVNRPEDIEGILVTHSRNFVKNPGFQTIKRVLGEGLLSSEGEFHLQQRRMIQPAFHRKRVAAYGAVMVEEALKLRSRWQPGSVIDISQEMIRLTLRIVSRALFSADLNAETGQISQAVDDAMSLFHQATSPVSLLVSRLPGAGDWRFRRGRKRLDETILQLIQQRRALRDRPDDLLSMLIAAQDEDTGQGMSDTQVRDEALTILMAGHETTATGLAWTWYLLSRHPKVEAGLHAELDAVLQGRQLTVGDLPQLEYTRMVFSEVLRLYPPIYMLGRQALEDHSVGEYVIPAGASLIISPYLLHHHPRTYPDPESFNPERFRSGSSTRQHKLAYLPFGAGPRVCVGEPFAWQEAVLVLAALAQHWKLRLVSEEPVQMLPRVTLRPKGGIHMVLEER